jgi:hypothetical protein
VVSSNVVSRDLVFMDIYYGRIRYRLQSGADPMRRARARAQRSELCVFLMTF